MFPQKPFGKYVLKRKRLLKEVSKAITQQREERGTASQSIYLSGYRGMGKSSLLMLIAKDLNRIGYEVYYFGQTTILNDEIVEALKEKVNQKEDDKLLAVLVDDATASRKAEALPWLLSSDNPNLVTIGAAVPKFVDFAFRAQLGTTELRLQEYEKDFVKLIDHIKRLELTTPVATDFICRLLLRQCRGHVFPTLAFIEAYFTTEELKPFIEDEVKFFRHFGTPAFDQTNVHQFVKDERYVEIYERLSVYY